MLIIDKTNLICNKKSILRIARNGFMEHKRTNEILVMEYTHNFVVSYKGKRDDENIKAGMVVLRVIKREGVKVDCLGDLDSLKKDMDIMEELEKENTRISNDYWTEFHNS